MYAVYEEARDALGLNDYQVSKLANVTPQALSAWKHGKYTPKASRLKRIAAVVRCPLADLIPDEDKKGGK